MKFFKTATVFAAGISTALSAGPFLKGRQSTVFGTISATLTDLETSIAANEASIVLAANTATTILNATAAAIINNNLNQIAAAVQKATGDIANQTKAAGAAIAAGTLVLTQQDILLLISDIQQVHNITTGIGTTLAVTASQLGLATKALVLANVIAVQATLLPFVTPLAAFVAVVAGTNLTPLITVLKQAIGGLQSIINGILATLGLPLITIP